jgi:hypothetical protein
MISEHEFVVAVRDKIYPKAREIESLCLEIFNKHYSPGRGPTGLSGNGEISWTIQYLKSSIAFIERLDKELRKTEV